MILTCPTADAVSEIERRLEEKIGQRRIQMWFKNSARMCIDGRHLRIRVPNNHVRGWIENHFSAQLRTIASDTLGRETDLTFEIDPELLKTEIIIEKKENRNPTAAVPPATPRLRRKLRNSLENFIVGPGNELAYNAIQSIASKVSSPFNPLFIHGGCGLGKTHLLQGLCNALSDQHPNVTWHYVSGEEFTNQFIVAVRTGALDTFRRQYRNVDVLVIDDVHFLANKRATQEEFLHTYNAINAAGKQVVMASDAHPKLIGQLHNSLVDRFISGMVVHIDLPDATTRATIIRAKAQQLGHALPDAVVQVMARGITGNIRELEGAILKLFAYASLCNKPIGMEIAEKIVREFGGMDRADIRISTIEDKVADYFSVSVNDIQCSKRTRTVALARAVAMYLTRKHTALSFPEIGKSMGNKNHSTVILACKKVEQLLSSQQQVSWDAADRLLTRSISTVISDLESQLKQANG